MRHILFYSILTLFTIFGFLSCGSQGTDDDLTYSLTIVNNSSRDIESVGLTYTGIKSRAPSVDYEKTILIPTGNTETVDLVLDPSTNYYNLFIFNNTSSNI